MSVAILRNAFALVSDTLIDQPQRLGIAYRAHSAQREVSLLGAREQQVHRTGQQTLLRFWKSMPGRFGLWCRAEVHGVDQCRQMDSVCVARIQPIR